jgi:hypothetical protein
MTAQETKLLNAFETTLSTTLGASGTTATLTAVTDAASNNIEAPCYLVIEPDSSTNREYVLVSAINVGTKTITLGDGGSSYRFLKGSSASSGLSHASGSTIRYVPMAQHIEDINDRVDTIINEAGTAVNTTLFLDEDDMSSDSATKGVTQQSVKAYVDSQVTAQDLDFLGDTGTGAVDLDSQDLTIAGTANEIETSASGQTLTIGLPSSITVNVTGDVTGDLTGNVTATSVLADGVTATTQSASDNSTKVATTAYVDAQVTAEGLDFGGDTGTGSVDLDSQTFTIAGTTNEIETSATGQTLTIGLPSSITVNVTGDLTGNASTATALETARTIGGVSFDGTANISLPGVDTAGTQNTSGTAAGLSATLVVGSGGTGQTSYTDGQLLIGNSTGNTLDKATLTQGSNVTITNGGGSITIAATDTNTEYTAGDGLDLTGTVFSTDLKTNGGLSIDTTELKLDLNDLSAASVSVANDSIAIIDADDNSSKKESIADLATAMADGSTITASNGVLTAAGGGGVSLGLVLALG